MVLLILVGTHAGNAKLTMVKMAYPFDDHS
jgi:hypothetical protein